MSRQMLKKISKNVICCFLNPAGVGGGGGGGAGLKGGGWGWWLRQRCILSHRGIQLRLADSWARQAILVAGEGRGGMFLFLLFLYFHSFSSFSPVPLFHLLYSSISLLPFSGR